MKIPLLCVVGPTASGKTGLAIELAKWYGGEVVSADSMQVYTGMDIATAKPTAQEMDGIPHHLLDFLPSDQSFSVAEYLQLARGCIADIWGGGRLPILCGGTGLYISSLLDHLQFAAIPSDEGLRAELRHRAQQLGAPAMLEELRSFDPQAAEKLHPNNLGRVLRAIEVYRLSGITMTEHQRRSREGGKSPYESCVIGLCYRDRDRLYERIERRVDLMLEAGLLDEAKAFFANENSHTAVQAIGYKELYPYLTGEATLEEAVASLKTATRRYAKRQLTWFRRMEDIHWIEMDALAEGQTPLSAARDILEASALWAYLQRPVL